MEYTSVSLLFEIVIASWPHSVEEEYPRLGRINPIFFQSPVNYEKINEGLISFLLINNWNTLYAYFC